MKHIVYSIVERCSVVNAAIGYIYICESVYIQSVAKQIFQTKDVTLTLTLMDIL